MGVARLNLNEINGFPLSVKSAGCILSLPLFLAVDNLLQSGEVHGVTNFITL